MGKTSKSSHTNHALLYTQRSLTKLLPQELSETMSDCIEIVNTRTHGRGQNDPEGGSQMDFSKHSGDIFLVFLDFVSNLCPHMMVVQLFR